MSEKVNKSVKIDIKEGLKEIYPEIFEDNKINFEKLKSMLSGEIIEKEDDRFYFNWAGKNALYKLIQAPAYGTLKPDKERSIDFDNTENIVIVGESLETLKLLLKPYFGKVKMIYIDPPEEREELKKKYLEWLGMWVDQPLVFDWKEIDVIYEVMLKEGLNLNSRIEKIKIKNDEFYYVKDEIQNLDFYISLKDKFSPETIEEIRTPKYKGKVFVFLDKALTDNDKINLSAFVRLKVI